MIVSRIMLAALSLLLATLVSAMEPDGTPLRTEFPWGSITCPAVVSVGSTVLLQVEVRADAVPATLQLRADVHWWKGTERAGVIASQGPFPLPASTATRLSIPLTITAHEGLSAIACVIYASKSGLWEDLAFSTEIGLPLRVTGAPSATAAVQSGPLPMADPPLVEDSSTRGHLVLNGPWLFRPMQRGEVATTVMAEAEWGQIWVPGSWRSHSLLPGLIRSGAGAAWVGFSGDSEAAWYERSVVIPQSWQGRAVLLDLARVSTDALVSVNGQECGRVTWPEGIVDISAAVQPGQLAHIRLLVVAGEESGTRSILMGTATADRQVQARLDSRGLIGDVQLMSRPRTGWIEDIVVIPSVRNHDLAVRATVRNAGGGMTRVTARFLNETGAEERRFTSEVDLKPAEAQELALKWSWNDPRLWDIRQPNLYTLCLDVDQPGLVDCAPQRFGFREFWIDGSRFMLNGREIRLRPMNTPAETWDGIGGVHEAIDNAIDGMLGVGFNTQEVWPYDQSQRGTVNFWPAWYDAADRKGMLTMGAVPFYAIRGKALDEIDWSPAKRALYKQTVRRYLRRELNHPAVVMWGSNTNDFGLDHDMNPRVLGRRDWVPEGGRDYQNHNRVADLVRAAGDAVAAIKEVDPTRAVFTHFGGYIGDLHTSNAYLCWTPLQEREEWLSGLRKQSDMPYMVVEFGSPLNVDFCRERGYNFQKAIGSEPLATEFCAAYQGEDAYRREGQEYRRSIPQRFQGGTYSNWYDYNRFLEQGQPVQSLIELFTTNTYRSWRTWGIPGGMVPWDKGHGFAAITGDEPLAPFAPGLLGTWRPTLPSAARYFLLEGKGWTWLPAGKALHAANQGTLAWIAGSAAAFTAKDHSYFTNETIAKQIMLLNDDSVRPLPYHVEWTATLGDLRVAGATLDGEISSAQTLALPIAVPTPDIGSDFKRDGEITINVRIGDHVHQDHFAFRVFARVPAPVAPADHLAVFDPEGRTTAYLQSLGYHCTVWDGKPAPLVVIGRRALSAAVPPPTDLERYVRDGGRVILCAQDPAWQEGVQHLRTAHQVTRRAYPIAHHPLVQGLDAEDFRDWRGAGTLVPSEAGTDLNQPVGVFGYHWGNRGSVASAALEKPHCGAWRPVLQCEFDLAFSPLLELPYGQGLLLWCALDLEDRGAVEPVAAILIRRLVDYAAHTPTRVAETKVSYVGDTSTADLLSELGLVTEALNDTTGLIIVGSGADEGQLKPFIERGVPILVLAQRATKGLFGVTYQSVTDFAAATQVPEWPECLGLSLSDMHRRSPGPAWLLKGGCDIAAEGLLGRIQVGRSTVIFCQLDPHALEADHLTYLRFTRWRQMRGISNLIGNLGGNFAGDANVFANREAVVSLAGPWAGMVTTRLAPAASPQEAHPNTFSDQAKSAVSTSVDDSTWPRFLPTTMWDAYGSDWEKMDGEAVFRMTVEVPAAWAGQDLQLSLGAIDDFDNTFWNGVQVGRTHENTPSFWSAKRLYTIPGSLVIPGRTVIAVRIFDHFGQGGFHAQANELWLRAKPTHVTPANYRSDYLKDAWDGDDPARFCRW